MAQQKCVMLCLSVAIVCLGLFWECVSAPGTNSTLRAGHKLVTTWQVWEAITMTTAAQKKTQVGLLQQDPLHRHMLFFFFSTSTLTHSTWESIHYMSLLILYRLMGGVPADILARGRIPSGKVTFNYCTGLTYKDKQPCTIVGNFENSIEC